MALVQDYSPPEDLALSAIGPGIVDATLTTEWSSISGIRKGFRIIEDVTGGGEAFVITDPQFQALTVEVQVIKAFTSTTILSANWILRVPRQREVGTYVPPHVQNTEVLPDYFAILQDVSIDEVQDAIIRLRNLRRWDKMDVEFLDVFLQSMGMFLNTEEFDEETRRRLVKELPTFLEISGTENFLSYLGFSVGALFTATELYTKDYKDFVRLPDVPAIEVNDYYPTNHVDLDFDATIFGAIADQVILDTFYQLASLPLVIQRINQQFISVTLFVVGTAGGFSVEVYTAEP